MMTQSSGAPFLSACRARASQSIEALAQNWRLIAFVFLPFAAGFYLSYLFRNINAVIAGPLTSELGLDAGQFGLLTSVYFLTFAAAQLPVGILLDRYGPRRVQSGLFVVAACGAALVRALREFRAARPLSCADRSWRCGGSRGRSESHRLMVPEGTPAARQWLDDHAGCARRGHRNHTGRGAARLDRLERAFPFPGSGNRRMRAHRLPGRAGCSIHGANRRHADSAGLARRFHRSAGSGGWRRCQRPLSARPGRCRACGRPPGSPTWSASTGPRSCDTCSSWPSRSAWARF